MRKFCDVLISCTVLWMLTAGAAISEEIITDGGVRECLNRGAPDARPTTADAFQTPSEQTLLAACLETNADEAIRLSSLTRLEDIWFTLSEFQFSPDIFPDQDGLLRQLEQAGWSELNRRIDAALEKRDVAEAETLIKRARTELYQRLASEQGPREGAGRYALSVGTLWTEYRHGQDRLLVRLRGTFKGELGSDPCLRITNATILDQNKKAFRKGKNVRRGSGGNPGVGVGGAVGGGSRSGVGGGVGVSVDLTPLFGGRGDGRVARIFRMTGAAGPTNSWTIAGTFRNHCDRSKETFSIPLVPRLNQDAGGITIEPPLSPPAEN